ncbi:phage tail protein, partial [Pseudomonas tussilaginis]|uniref:phage tail protein n=1 Tax=Pseudomonas sp. 5 TaxID=1619949 RepID=UPI000AC9885D
ITQMAVGDGNPGGLESPALPMPDASWTSLLNEWRRAPLNQLKVDDKDNSIIVAEQVIPAEIGGRWIREVGLYDADGDLVAVANCAPTYKPLLNQGSGRTQVVRMNLVVSSSSNVQLKIDPSVVLATREWVTEELARQDFKHSVIAATTANVVLSGLQTVDGVALVAGARVLVKNQAAAKDNGLYLVVAGGPWARCNDADSNAKVTPGLLVQVERGTVNGDSAWQLVTDAPITLGVTALVFEMAFGRTGVAAGTYRSVTVDVNGRVTAATNPTTVAGYGLTDVYTKTQIDQALTLKAPLVSPALTGVPTAPTPAAGTNTTQLANTAFVQKALADLVASSPAALDTLNELAAAIGNDPNFAASMTNMLALKAPLASPTFTGDPKAPTPAANDIDTSIATTAFVRAAMALYGIGAPGSDIPDADLAPRTGIYRVPSGLNCPKPGSYHLIHIERAAGQQSAQIAIVDGGSAVPANIWTRNRHELGIWSEWEASWTTRTLAFASQGEAEAGAVDNKMMSPLRVFQAMRLGFAASFGANGYIQFPSWFGGFLIQWVSVSTATGQTTPFTWPLAFSTIVRTAGIAHTAAPVFGNVSSVTPNGGNADTYNTAGSRVAANVQAIGVGK